MATHARYGITHGRTPLYFSALVAVGVVARPDLREVVKRSAVEPSATACTSLEEYVGKIVYKSFGEVVKAQCVPMQKLALSLSG